MFSIKRRIRLSETDSTGVLYFTNLFKFAAEAFEEFLQNKELGFFSTYLLPIVSAKSSYMAPLFLNDEITLSLNLTKIGETSIELQTDVIKDENLVAKVEIIHVLTSKLTMKKIKIEGPVKEYLIGELMSP